MSKHPAAFTIRCPQPGWTRRKTRMAKSILRCTKCFSLNWKKEFDDYNNYRYRCLECRTLFYDYRQIKEKKKC